MIVNENIKKYTIDMVLFAKKVIVSHLRDSMVIHCILCVPMTIITFLLLGL